MMEALNHRFFLRFFIAIAVSFLLLSSSEAQIIGGDAFLQGNVLEVGVATNGAFGSNGDAPAGYHPRPNNGSNQIGFVADRDQDGFTVGVPPFDGDYFLPGRPEEAWGVSVGADNYNNSRETPTDIAGALSNFQNDGTNISVDWSGTVAGGAGT